MAGVELPSLTSAHLLSGRTGSHNKVNKMSGSRWMKMKMLMLYDRFHLTNLKRESEWNKVFMFPGYGLLIMFYSINKEEVIDYYGREATSGDA